MDDGSVCWPAWESVPGRRRDTEVPVRLLVPLHEADFEVNYGPKKNGEGVEKSAELVQNKGESRAGNVSKGRVEVFPNGAGDSLGKTASASGWVCVSSFGLPRRG